MSLIFGEIITAMVTPFNKHYELDLSKVKKLVNHLENTGTQTIIIAGTTGEGPTLTEPEKLVLLDEVYKHKSPQTKIIMNVGTNNTYESFIRAKYWNSNEKVDGIMVVCPYYNKPNQNGLFKHFEMINNAVNKPIMAYHIPGRTNVTLAAETMIKIARLSNVKMLKDAEGNLAKLQLVINKTTDLWDVYSGDDPNLLEYLKIGAKGIVSVASHIAGKEIQELIASYKAGSEETAIESQEYIKAISDQLFPSFSPNPVPVKFLLSTKNLIEEHVRLPLTELYSEEKDSILENVQNAKVLLTSK